MLPLALLDLGSRRRPLTMGLVLLLLLKKCIIFVFSSNFRGFCFLWTILCCTWFLGFTQGNSEGKLHFFSLSFINKSKSQVLGFYNNQYLSPVHG